MTAPAIATTEPDIWTAQYKDRDGMRFWPCEALVRYVGEHYRLTALDGDNPQSVLEVGCGNGANLWFLARYFAHAHGLDMSQEALDLAEHLLGSVRAEAALSCGSVSRMPQYQDEEFDLVVDVQCIQHTTFSDHAAAYVEIARVLKPGGRFFSYHLGHKTAGYKRLFPRCGPVATPDAKWLRRAYLRAGFEPLSLTTVTREYDEAHVAQYWVCDAVKA
jgi:ubiquinone/menaquinone biosynthesis C-methylase UbiE